MSATARSTRSVSAAPHTPVRRIFALTAIVSAMASDGGAVDIDVVDAFEMGEDRHARLVLDARDQALAAARHDDVDRSGEPGEHQADGSAVARRHDLDRFRGKPGSDNPFGERLRGSPLTTGTNPTRREGSRRCRP